jgi:hypothetical protein
MIGARRSLGGRLPSGARKAVGLSSFGGAAYTAETVLQPSPPASTTTASRRAHFVLNTTRERRWGSDEGRLRSPGADLVHWGSLRGSRSRPMPARQRPCSGGGRRDERGSGNRGAGALDPQRPDPAAPAHACCRCRRAFVGGQPAGDRVLAAATHPRIWAPHGRRRRQPANPLMGGSAVGGT